MRAIKVPVIAAAAVVMQLPASPATADNPTPPCSTGVLSGNQIQVPVTAPISIGGHTRPVRLEGKNGRADRSATVDSRP